LTVAVARCSHDVYSSRPLDDHALVRFIGRWFCAVAPRQLVDRTPYLLGAVVHGHVVKFADAYDGPGALCIRNVHHASIIIII
jgi:hypothetical protein